MKLKFSGMLALLLALFSIRAPLFGQITYQTAPDAEHRKALLLRDFHPKSMMHAAAHSVERARFPVIDVHQHVDDAMGIGDRIPPARLVEINSSARGPMAEHTSCNA